MKFWKIGLPAVLAFFAACFIIVYTSCEKNVCDNVTCFNGGSCNSGGCHCPVGYEGPQCKTISRQRYLGVYAGTIRPNSGGILIDTVRITAAPNINYVYVADRYFAPEVLLGYVNNDEATYSIVVPDDSAKNFLRGYTIPLQGDKLLTINAYEHSMPLPGNTIFNNYYFNGSKQ